jgi:hypothetical protein
MRRGHRCHVTHSDTARSSSASRVSLRAERSNLGPLNARPIGIASSRETLLTMTPPNLVDQPAMSSAWPRKRAARSGPQPFMRKRQGNVPPLGRARPPLSGYSPRRRVARPPICHKSKQLDRLGIGVVVERGEALDHRDGDGAIKAGRFDAAGRRLAHRLEPPPTSASWPDRSSAIAASISPKTKHFPSARSCHHVANSRQRSQMSQPRVSRRHSSA